MSNYTECFFRTKFKYLPQFSIFTGYLFDPEFEPLTGFEYKKETLKMILDMDFCNPNGDLGNYFINIWDHIFFYSEKWNYIGNSSKGPHLIKSYHTEGGVINICSRFELRSKDSEIKKFFDFVHPYFHESILPGDLIGYCSKEKPRFIYYQSEKLEFIEQFHGY